MITFGKRCDFRTMLTCMCVFINICLLLLLLIAMIYFMCYMSIPFKIASSSKHSSGDMITFISFYYCSNDKITFTSFSLNVFFCTFMFGHGWLSWFLIGI
jgi:hypothetical protein